MSMEIDNNILRLIDILIEKLHLESLKINLKAETNLSIVINKLMGYYNNSKVLYLDGPKYVMPRNENYIYKKVKDLIDKASDDVLNFVEKIKPYYLSDSLKKIPYEKINEVDPFFNNGWFSGCDAKILYSTVAALKPNKIIEIGCGSSTKFINRSIKDFGLKTTLTTIDPSPRQNLDNVNINHIQKSLLECELDIFTTLEKGDILFLDGSHLVMNGTDTTMFFLEILPILKPGVIIHIHDILLPFEYVKDFSSLGFSEQYLLATLLLNNSNYKIMWASYYFSKSGKSNELLGVDNHHGQSFWFYKSGD